MNGLVEYGAAAGNLALMVCCVIGAVIIAMRASGLSRIFGVLGCSLIALQGLIGIGISLTPMMGPELRSPTLIWAFTMLTTVLKPVGLVGLGLSFLSSRERGDREVSVPGDHGPGQVVP